MGLWLLMGRWFLMGRWLLRGCDDFSWVGGCSGAVTNCSGHACSGLRQTHTHALAGCAISLVRDLPGQTPFRAPCRRLRWPARTGPEGSAPPTRRCRRPQVADARGRRRGCCHAPRQVRCVGGGAPRRTTPPPSAWTTGCGRQWGWVARATAVCSRDEEEGKKGLWKIRQQGAAAKVKASLACHCT
eukprot:96959-Chlamydomonas_euryale.AAC.2